MKPYATIKLITLVTISLLTSHLSFADTGVKSPATKAFVYTEVQNSVPFGQISWEKRNSVLSSQAGLISKTWLSGLGNNSVGGIYSFDSMENARKYVTESFPNALKKQGVAHTTRIFDAIIVEEASRDMGSPYFGNSPSTKLGAFVYIEIQVTLPFADVPWQQRNPVLKKIPGLLSKTWLSGVNNTVGGFYAFDTIENAKHFVIEIFPETAAKMNAPSTTRIFDARVVEGASRGIHSPFFN